MSEYCTTCGGRPHADLPSHFMTWGRLAPHGSLHDDVPVPEDDPTPPDGPTMVREALPEGAPRNARWLAGLPAKKVRIADSWGIWKGKETRVLGVAGICEGDVRFYGAWKWSQTTEKWSTDQFWLRTDGQSRKVSWREMKGGLDEWLAGK